MLFILLTQTASANPNSGITYHGRILKPDGQPLQGAHVSFRLQIRTPGSENCLLYEEVHSRDMRNSNGIFSLTLNDGTGTRGSDSGHNLERVFQNRGTFAGLPDCKGGSNDYTPSASDGRRLAVFFRDETMSDWVPLPPTLINFVPLAIEARSLGGFNVTNVIRVADSGVPGAAPVLSSNDVLELDALLKGTSTQYLPRSISAGAVLPLYSGGEPSAPQAGSIWYDDNDGSIKFYNGSSTVTLGTGSGSGTVTSITAGEGLTGGTITTSGTIALQDVGSPGTYYQVTTDEKGRVVSGKTNLDASDIPDLDWAKITIGKPTTLDGYGITDAIKNAGNVLSFQSGPDASKPAAGSLGRVYVAWDTQKIYFDDGAVWTVVASVDVGGGGTVTEVKVSGAPLSVTNGTTAPEISISQAGPGSSGYLTQADWNTFNSKLSSALNSGQIFVGNASNEATAVQPSGDVSMSDSGVFTVTRIQGQEIDSAAPSGVGQVLRWDSTKYVPAFLSLADIRSTVNPGNTIFPASSCTAGQTLTWSSLTDTFACTNIALDESSVTFASKPANTVFAAPNGSSGQPTFRALVEDDIPNLSWSKILNPPTTLAGLGITDAVIKGGQEGEVSLGSTDANSLKFKTNDMVQMTITSEGKVGIGTGIPATTLDVAGNLRVQTDITAGKGLSYTGGAISAHFANNYVPIVLSNPTGYSHIRVNGFELGGNTNVNDEGYIKTANNDRGIYLSPTVGIRFVSTPGSEMRFTTDGKLGIGTATPAAKLVVAGAAINESAISNSTTTIDFSTGNLQFTTNDCGSFNLHNLKSGGSYTFAVQGTNSATCSFNAYSDAGVTPLTVHMPPDHGPTIASKHTLYTLIVMGTHAYVSWIPGL